ncbi:MAG: type III secretion system cytoplasmic ring protein SctQ [Candidatus Algichlamydia australiensis]|nr:type III secretion system cytoplasmic ring protein SctQ [Chlamydiales bacterium]
MEIAEAIEDILKEAMEIPAWGTPPQFPWEDFSHALGSELQIENFKLTVGEGQWSEDPMPGLGATPISLAFEMTPLKSPALLLIPKEDLTTLCELLGGENIEESFSADELIKGFFRFIGMRVANVLDQKKIYGDLTPKILQGEVKPTAGYTLDIALEMNGQTIWTRLLLPKEFQEGFRNHFGTKENLLAAARHSQIEVPVAFTAGFFELPLKEFKSLKSGDFVFLDRAPYHPLTQKGTLEMDLQGAPLFHTKVKDNQIKIMGVAQFAKESEMEHDENAPMAPEENIPVEEESAPAVIAPETVPLQIHVEMTRIKITLEKLLQLAPGNVLDLAVKPEQGISLTLNGKVVGRGELIEIGERLGVKITEIK